MSQRKLIRPKLSDVRQKKRKSPVKRTQSHSGRKSNPPEQTFAEIYYYLKQMQSKTDMVVVLKDGETFQGWIEWYDKEAIKLNRHNAPNLLITKSSIKYMFKEKELHESDQGDDTATPASEEESGEEKKKPATKAKSKSKSKTNK